MVLMWVVHSFYVVEEYDVLWIYHYLFIPSSVFWISELFPVFGYIKQNCYRHFSTILQY